MDDKERIMTMVIKGLVEYGVMKITSNYNFIISTGCVALVGQAVEWLMQFLCSGYRRVSAAVRERNPENGVVEVICREIVAIGLEFEETIVEYVMEIINFLKKSMERSYNRGANFTESLGQKSLSLTSYSSRRHL